MNNLQNSRIQTPKDVKFKLHNALDQIPDFERCAFLDCPSHYNIGDHLIWLGGLFYLTQTRQANIEYISTKNDFSESEFSTKSREGPIFLHGGGNFGDLWPGFQDFRENIALNYKNRPVIILPQTAFFSSEEALEKSAKIFNQHPDLTIFAREDKSYGLLKKAFFKCRILKAPDMAFQLVDLPKSDLGVARSGRILYLCRTDHEIDNAFEPDKLGIENLEIDDWVSFRWMKKAPQNWIYFPGRVSIVRELWQRGLSSPKEWLSRQVWQRLHPSISNFSKVPHTDLHRTSWGLMHSGIYQLQGYDLLITNRLHVHILCLILEIPHILLPGSYYKITSFYRTWTSEISSCRFIEKLEDIPIAVKELTKKGISN